MKQVLPELKEMVRFLKFVKKCFSKMGFAHLCKYVGGLIGLANKTIQNIADCSIDVKNQSSLNRFLTRYTFKIEEIKKKYYAKIKYLTKGKFKTLIFDDTNNEKTGKKMEEAQKHHDHSSDGFIYGHQFFTAVIHTDNLVLPLFPQLYSKNTDSKIEMARVLTQEMIQKMGVDQVSFDSWYSDKKLIKQTTTKNKRVICTIKTNRKIRPNKGDWKFLKEHYASLHDDSFEFYFIDEKIYKIRKEIIELKSIGQVKLLISYEWDIKKQKFKDAFFLISTDLKQSTVSIIREYEKRWCIETFHRDMKQHLGFNTYQMRKKTGIVRHTILVTLTYAILKLFILEKKVKWTIGQCCRYLQGKEFDDLIIEIIEIEDKQERIDTYTHLFKRQTAKV